MAIQLSLMCLMHKHAYYIEFYVVQYKQHGVITHLRFTFFVLRYGCMCPSCCLVKIVNICHKHLNYFKAQLIFNWHIMDDTTTLRFFIFGDIGHGGICRSIVADAAAKMQENWNHRKNWLLDLSVSYRKETICLCKQDQQQG